MKVMLATPTTNGIVNSGLVSSVVAATQTIQGLGGQYGFFSIDGADVVTARNLIAHRFLADQHATHLLCLDSDMLVDRAVFNRFFKANKPMVGAAYPERNIDMDLFAKAMATHGQKSRAMAEALRFNVRLLSGRHSVTNHLCAADRLGFGCVLIQRRVFEALISQKLVNPWVSNKWTGQSSEQPIYNFFGQLPLTNGELLSEDYSFCERVSRLSDPGLFAYIGAGVEHVGNFHYGASYFDQLTQHQNAQDI